MIYRVLISQTYSEVRFDFEDIQEACVFAETVMNHGYRGNVDPELRDPLDVTIRILKEGE